MHLDVLKPSCVEAKPTMSRAFEELAVACKTACPSHQDLMSESFLLGTTQRRGASVLCGCGSGEPWLSMTRVGANEGAYDLG